MVFCVFEYRLINDYWLSTMGLFGIYSGLNYTGFEFEISSIISLILGVLCLLTPIYTLSVNSKLQDKTYIEDEHWDEDLEQKIAHNGYKYRSFT